jgi:hypothetical protein
MDVLFDSKIDERGRLEELYRGSVLVYTPSPGAVKLCEFAREMVEAAFYPHNPLTLHETIPVERCVEILAELKPKFIHHPRCKELLTAILAEHGCDLDKVYFDVPRLRTAFPGDYLSAGIAYAFHPHRDTWYSAPYCQINWWVPVYEITPKNGMAFHVQYWDNPVPNSSATYNYQEWNRTSRQNAAQHVKADTRVQPRAQIALDPDPRLCLVAPVGGVMLFSAAQLHSTVPNTSGVVRYSIDFRTVHLDDVREQHGAPNIDSVCTGTTMMDYLRGSDLSRLPEELIEAYYAGNQGLSVR